METQRMTATTQISRKMKSEFLDAINDEYNGASDFFRRRILEKCNVERKREGKEKETGAGYVSLNVSITPEQRAALLKQCENEGITMGTWMRNQIKTYLESKKRKKSKKAT